MDPEPLEKNLGLEALNRQNMAPETYNPEKMTAPQIFETARLAKIHRVVAATF